MLRLPLIIVSPTPAMETDIISLADRVFDDEAVTWKTEASSWIREPTKMRYDPQMHNYHMFLGGPYETRMLVYHVDGDVLSLSTSGIDGARNWWQFLDPTWDQIYLYSPLEILQSKPG